jgi:hypothetical protein
MFELFFPILFLLAAGVGVASIQFFPFVPSRFRKSHLLVFLPSAVGLLVIVWGRIMERPAVPSPGWLSTPTWPENVVTVLLLVAVISGTGAIYAMKGYRIFALSAVLLQLWIWWFVAGFSGMSVMGQWL